jgi:D-glycero-alpha-D-manno-heptose-7-phosphate kinase
VATPVRIRASAPTRLDFGGGWTDVPPYPEDRGGFVCNLAIERRATVTLEASASDHATPVPALARAALADAGLSGLHATLHSDFPVGAGLGGSSAAGVALAAAIAAWQHLEVPPAELAERSRRTEVEQLGIAGGRQDHYAAAFGGALALTFEREVRVDPIALAPETVAALEARCLVYYTGESRISGNTIQAVLDAYAERQPSVVLALDRMAVAARLMAAALASGDLDALGALVGEHWVDQRSLHPGITTPRIDALVAATRDAGALGAKPLGASGGGCVLVVAPADAIEAVHWAAVPFGERLPFRVAAHGVRLEPLDADHA